MNLTLERITSDDDSTIGTLYLDQHFQCFTLEDEYREFKVAKETRIPAGTYKIGLRRGSPMAGRYMDRYGPSHIGMLWLRDVPGFEWIYIHTGNTDDHTEGCILVGDGAYAAHSDMKVQASRQAYMRLYSAVVDAADHGDLTITIIDRDLEI